MLYFLLYLLFLTTAHHSNDAWVINGASDPSLTDYIGEGLDVCIYQEFYHVLCVVNS